MVSPDPRLSLDLSGFKSGFKSGVLTFIDHHNVDKYQVCVKSGGYNSHPLICKTVIPLQPGNTRLLKARGVMGGINVSSHPLEQ